QAEGKNNLLFPRVVSKVSPESTVNSFSPFTVMVTGPDGDSLDFAKSNTPTKARSTTRKTIIATNTVITFLQCDLSLLQFYSHKAHERDAHQPRNNKGDPQSAQRTRNIRITYFLTYCGNRYNGEEPTHSRSQTKHGGIKNIRVLSFLHKECSTQ